MRLKAIALIALALILCSPAVAYIDKWDLYIDSASPNGTTIITSPTLAMVYLNTSIVWNQAHIACSDTVNVSSYSYTGGNPDGYLASPYTGGINGVTYYNYDTTTYPQCAARTYYQIWSSFGGDKFLLTQWYNNGFAPVNVTFSVSETGNFTHKLQGALVTSSSGSSGTTDINGTVTLPITPAGSSYTYTSVLAGYADTTGSIGAAGTLGGTIYISMTPGASSSTVRTYVRAVDGTGGAWVTGANVAIKNDQTGVWTNATNTIDGSHYIDILSNQTLSGYVSGTGYTGGSQVNLQAWDGVYEIPMYALGTLLTPGIGEVSVVVEVKDQITKVKIIGAHVDYTKSTGATEGYSTGSSGTANFLAPNVSTINVKVSKDGYTSVSKAITTTAFGPDYVLVYLPRVQAVPTDTYGNPIPTATIAGDNNHDGVVDEKDSVPGVTPITTLDTRTNSQKDNDLMNILRNNAESILWLCILAIIFGLLKMIMRF